MSDNERDPATAGDEVREGVGPVQPMDPARRQARPDQTAGGPPPSVPPATEADPAPARRPTSPPAPPQRPAASPPRSGARRPRPSAVGAVDRVRRADFPVVLRGYDRASVDAYVADVAQLVAELEATQLPETVVERALDDVGEQTSAILKRAHEAAEEIAERSRAQAGSRIDQAERDAELTRREAEDNVRRLEGDMRSIWQERQRLIEDIRHLADDVLALADDAIDRLPAPGEDETVAEEPGDEEPREVEQTQAPAREDDEVEAREQAELGTPPRDLSVEDRELSAGPPEAEPGDEVPPTAVEGGPDEDTAERPSRP